MAGEKMQAAAKEAGSSEAPAGTLLLGEILIELGLCSSEAITKATRTRDAEAEGGQALRVRRLGEILVDAGVITQQQLVQGLDLQALRRQAVRMYRPPAVRTRVMGSARRNLRVLSLGTLAAALLYFGGVPAIDLLRSLRARSVLLDPNASLEARHAALSRLAIDPASESSDAIAHVASHPKAPLEIREAALRVLAIGRGGESVRTALVSTLQDEHEGVRAQVAWILGDRADVRASVPALLKHMKDESPLVRVVAARALALSREIDGAGGTSGETRALLVAATDPTWSGRASLAHLLSRPEEEITSGAVRALEALSGFRIGGNVRLWKRWLELQPACDQLVGGRRGPDVVRRIEGALDSGRMSARFIASRALAHLGDPRGAIFLARVMDPEETALRETLRSEKSIDAAALEPEIGALLSLLTGQEFGTAAKLWRAWLDENGVCAVPRPGAIAKGRAP